MSAQYVYHYHAMRHKSPAVIRHIDGISVQASPILNYADYLSLKQLIAERDGTPDIDVDDEIIVCSLTLLSAPPASEG